MIIDNSFLVTEGRKNKLKIEIPEKDTNKGIIFVPGISSGPWGEKYDKLSRKAVGNGFVFLRFEGWESSEDLQTKTLSEIHRQIDSAIEVLRDKGCEEISVIGKSFGGGVILTYGLDRFKKSVLWAPAIGVDRNSNIDYWKDKKLVKVEGLKEIKKSFEQLKDIDTPVKIVHGTSDPVIEYGNSEKIKENLKEGYLEKIKGAGHSYDKKENFAKVLTETITFLIDN